MDQQTDIDGIRAKIATLEADRDRTAADDVKANIQAEIDTWILIHAHVLLSTRYDSPETAAELARTRKNEESAPARQPKHSGLRMLFSVKQLIVVSFTLGAIVGAASVWLVSLAK